MAGLLVPIWAVSLGLLAPVPQPKLANPNAPTPAEIRAGFGQKYTHFAPRKLGRRLGSPELLFDTWIGPLESKQEHSTCFYWVWRNKGLNVLFADEKMDTVWLYNDGVEDHKRYGGALPEGLTFDDTLEVALKKLGPPEVENSELDRADKTGTAVIGVETSYGYPGKGLEVVFYKPIEGEPKMINVQMFAPTKPKPGDRR